jgi:hypothetical protein
VGARGEAQGFPERAAAGLNSGSFRYLAKAGKIEGVQGYAGCGLEFAQESDKSNQGEADSHGRFI